MESQSNIKRHCSRKSCGPVKVMFLNLNGPAAFYIYSPNFSFFSTELKQMKSLYITVVFVIGMGYNIA